jgi:hypothetical protein
MQLQRERRSGIMLVLPVLLLLVLPVLLLPLLPLLLPLSSSCRHLQVGVDHPRQQPRLPNCKSHHSRFHDNRHH